MIYFSQELVRESPLSLKWYQIATQNVLMSKEDCHNIVSTLAPQEMTQNYHQICFMYYDLGPLHGIFYIHYHI